MSKKCLTRFKLLKNKSASIYEYQSKQIMLCQPFFNVIKLSNNKIIIIGKKPLKLMNKYYSLSPSNKTEIHNLLSPIFDVVRKNKIHSYYQLQKKDDQNQIIDQSKTNHYIFQPKPKTAQVIHNKLPSQFSTKARLTYHTLYSPAAEKLQPKTPSVQLSRATKNQVQNNTFNATFLLKQRKKADSISYSNQRRATTKLFRVNSKIKKHLVEEIDFEEIEKMFYKKRQTMTRYQHFLKNKHKNKTLSQKQQKSKSKRQQKQTKLIKIQDETNTQIVPSKQSRQIPLYHTYLHQQFATMPVKNYVRKKFWLKQAVKRDKKSPNSEYPMVEGTSMRTIQT